MGSNPAFTCVYARYTYHCIPGVSWLVQWLHTWISISGGMGWNPASTCDICKVYLSLHTLSVLGGAVVAYLDKHGWGYGFKLTGFKPCWGRRREILGRWRKTSLSSKTICLGSLYLSSYRSWIIDAWMRNIMQMNGIERMNDRWVIDDCKNDRRVICDYVTD